MTSDEAQPRKREFAPVVAFDHGKTNPGPERRDRNLMIAHQFNERHSWATS